ncbi:MAG TPA: VOC family protein [Candidatus Limnocylindrales bacterium]|nr:VOC family protein [Candidatus Limnocylindrales bacterium]
MSEPRVTGLGGVFFKAHDANALGQWYRTHLGIPVQEGGFAIFQWREHDDAAREGSTVWAVFDETTDYLGKNEQRAMLNYRVADLDAVLAALRSEGVSVDDKVQSDENGRFGWITDPEGNRIELWQPPAGG